MKKRILSFLIIFCLQQNFFCSFSYSQQTLPPSAQKSNIKTKKKSPWVALGIAFFPGIIIHGAGHTYAGKHKTAALLFTSELIGLGLIGAGIVIISLTVFTKVGTLGAADISCETSGLVNILFGTGSVLFVGSWVYDVVGAPLSCRQNSYSLEPANFNQLCFVKKDDINFIKITVRF